MCFTLRVFDFALNFIFKQSESDKSSTLLSKEEVEGIKAKVLPIMQKFSNKTEEEILAVKNLSDLGLDSLRFVEVIMSIEDAFGIEIKDEEAEELVSLEKLIECIVSKTQKEEITG